MLFRSVQAGVVAFGRATPYLAVVDLLKSYFQIEDQDDHRKIREKVTGRLFTLDRTLESMLPPLLALLDVPVEDATWQTLDPRERRLRTLAAVRGLLLRESQVQPLLVIFEDLHWIDSETQALLDSVVETVPTARLLLLVNYRPEYEHRWGSRTYYTQLGLDPLPPESAEALLDALLGAAPGLEPLKRLLIERTQGNPFFLEESVQTLVETEVLHGERGAYRLAHPIDTIQVPTTVQALITARIDRLSSEEKRLLETAAVIGKDVPFALLQAVCDQDELRLRQGLAHLQVMEFLYETSLFPDLEYTFKHALTHEVTYGILLNEQRRTLHTRIVDAIEQLYAERLAEHVDWLAHHAFAGEQWDRAVSYLRQASAKAAARSAYPEAVAASERALIALAHVPETRETREQGIDVRFDLRSVLQALGDHERVFDHLHAAEVLASELQDQVRLGWASAYLSQYLWRMGELRRAEEMDQRALAIAAARGDFALEVVANFFLGQGYFMIGDYPHAIDHCRWNAAALEGGRAHERLGLTGLPSVLSRIWLARSLAERGEFAEAMEPAQQALAIAEAAGQHYSVTGAYLAIGEVQLVRGDLVRAIPMLERAFNTGKSWNLHLFLPTTGGLLGLAYTLGGRIAEALPVLEEAETRAPEIRIFNTPTAAIALGTVYLLAEKTDEALAVAARAAERAIRCGFRGDQARVSYLLGEICARRDPSDVQQAEANYREAMALAEDLGMRPLAAQCHLGLGMLYRQMDNHKRANNHLSEAVQRFREMDMPYWLKQAEMAC